MLLWAVREVGDAMIRLRAILFYAAGFRRWYRCSRFLIFQIRTGRRTSSTRHALGPLTEHAKSSRFGKPSRNVHLRRNGQIRLHLIVR
jgi:hypothetical protein